PHANRYILRRRSPELPWPVLSFTSSTLRHQKTSGYRIRAQPARFGCGPPSPQTSSRTPRVPTTHCPKPHRLKVLWGKRRNSPRPWPGPPGGATVGKCMSCSSATPDPRADRSEEHTSELQSRFDLVCRLLLE